MSDRTPQAPSASATSRPKKGKGPRVRGTPKGRAVDPKARADVLELLGDRPRRTDLLIEYLHLIQDRFRCLADVHLVALAAELKMSMAEVYEVATFYHHFDVVKDGEPAASGDHRPRLRLDRVRSGRFARAAGEAARHSRQGHPRAARAVRRPLRNGAGRRGRSEPDPARHGRERHGCGHGRARHAPAGRRIVHAPALRDGDAWACRLRHLRRGRRLRAGGRLRQRQADCPRT